MALLASRSAGVLLHITSLPGPYAGGDLGPDAHRFIDLLAAMGMATWQVLPLNPPGPGSSPYFALSSFAGNPALISPLSLGGPPPEPTAAASPHVVDFAAAAGMRDAALRRAFEALDPSGNSALDEFIERHRWWLDDWALFATLEHRFGAPWQSWPPELARREPAALDRLRDEYPREIRFHQFAQLCFARQWAAVRDHAAQAGVSILGDLPIFPALHSSDVWVYQHVFKLDAGGHPGLVGGVPPDYFSATGQRWGTPLYRWDVEAAGGYAYWRARLRRNTSYLIDNPDEMAANCAGDALFHIYHDRFPYDCNFHAWAYAILNIICRRMLHYLGSDSDLIHNCCMSIDTLDEYGLPPDDAAGPERVVGWLWDLERATEQLSTPNRRTFARLYYLEGKNYSQIAREMGKKIGALYKLNNDTLADYRRQLA